MTPKTKPNLPEMEGAGFTNLDHKKNSCRVLEMSFGTFSDVFHMNYGAKTPVSGAKISIIGRYSTIHY